ncbi:MAG: hypothetical protein HY738_19790 [Bacteroidia bacterium]|nr:hypothetical protein [Bacteroidia bacterium]
MKKIFLSCGVVAMFLTSCTQKMIWEGEKIYTGSITEDFTGKVLVIKDGTTIQFNDSLDGQPVDLAVIADEIEVQGKVTFIGTGEPGKDGANEGVACKNCTQINLEFKDKKAFDKACAAGLTDDDKGGKGDDGQDGLRGANIVFKSKKITGQENIDFSGLKGGQSGKGLKGGANRVYVLVGKEQKQCENSGGFGANGNDGAEGPAGTFTWEQLQ